MIGQIIWMDRNVVYDPEFLGYFYKRVITDDKKIYIHCSGDNFDALNFPALYEALGDVDKTPSIRCIGRAVPYILAKIDN
jgi:hypothetical protein